MINVLLLCVNENNKKDFTYYLNETKKLIEAADFNLVLTEIQNLKKIIPSTYIGSGKIESLNSLISEHSIELIITNDQLTLSQIRNISKITEIKVMDRTQLILEIFSIRAQTKEAKLQVAIAQLKYGLTKMVGSYDNLSRQGGGKVGTVNRGGGEKKIEIDRRNIKDTISNLENELNDFVTTRAEQRKKRTKSDLKIVALVGYTNVGKSSLMNRLTKDSKNVFEKDMLFATLDTNVGIVSLNDKHDCLLIDTVGFVSNLPHELIKAFRSTLEEILEADLIIHLHDISDENHLIQNDVVEDVLKSLNAQHIKKINVYNKIDLVENHTDYENCISIKNNIGISNLVELIDKEIYGQLITVEFKLSYSNISKLDYYHKNTVVLNIEYNNDYVLVTANMTKEQSLQMVT